MNKGNFFQYFFLVIIILGGLFLRMYKLDIPLADHHSWRQADTAAVARNFVNEGWDFFKPRIDNMTYLNSPNKLNTQRLFLTEPPIYQTIVAVLYEIFGVNISIARIVSVAFSLLSIVVLYLLARQYFGVGVGLTTAFIFAVLPFNIYYSRTVLPEPLMIFFTLGLLYFFDKWIAEEKKVWWLIALLFGGVAFTQKSFPVFLGLPLAYLVFQKYSFGFIKKPQIWLFVFLSLLPLVLWRYWISHFPEGIPPFDWLLNQGGIRFKGAFFWWIFAERIGKLIMGYWGLIPLGLGIILKPNNKREWFFIFWLLSVIIYIFVFAAGNVTHDYYQVPLIPILAIFLAKGVFFLLDASQQITNRYISAILATTCLIFAVSFSWYEVRNFYNIQGGVDLAGSAVNELTPKNSLVLTGDSNDATLLYNTNRYGFSGGYASYFPNTPQTIEKVKNFGVQTYVTTKWNELYNTDFGKYMTKNYSIVKQTDQYIIFDLESK